MPKRKDPIANEFGVADLNELFERDPQRGYAPGHDADMTRRQAHEELERRIHSGTLQPLNGRKVIEQDWLTDWDGYSEFHGAKPRGPTQLEQQELRREYGARIEKELAKASAGMQVRSETDVQPRSAEEMAERLYSDFCERYADLSGDASAIETAARSVIEEGGFDWNRRDHFYERVANKLRSEGRRHG